jgi:hypothetical protein
MNGWWMHILGRLQVDDCLGGDARADALHEERKDILNRYPAISIDFRPTCRAMRTHIRNTVVSNRKI